MIFYTMTRLGYLQLSSYCDWCYCIL